MTPQNVWRQRRVILTHPVCESYTAGSVQIACATAVLNVVDEEPGADSLGRACDT